MDTTPLHCAVNPNSKRFTVNGRGGTHLKHYQCVAPTRVRNGSHFVPVRSPHISFGRGQLILHLTLHHWMRHKCNAGLFSSLCVFIFLCFKTTTLLVLPTLVILGLFLSLDIAIFIMSSTYSSYQQMWLTAVKGNIIAELFLSISKCFY